jgi:hypothetical protein
LLNIQLIHSFVINIQKEAVMKTRTFISAVILIVALLLIAGSCATRKKAISDEDLSKAYTGTWINPVAMGYEVVKISDSGNSMERLYTTGEKRVEEWDLDNLKYTYKIYYRQ